jgi:hypothetical protein
MQSCTTVSFWYVVSVAQVDKQYLPLERDINDRIASLRDEIKLIKQRSDMTAFEKRLVHWAQICPITVLSSQACFSCLS